MFVDEFWLEIKIKSTEKFPPHIVIIFTLSILGLLD